MSFSRLLSGSGASQLARNPAALKQLDKQLMQSAKGSVSSKVMPAYGKYIAKPAGTPGGMLYGTKMDGAKLLTMLGGGIGGLHYGGAAARPTLNYLHSIAARINPEAMKHYGTNMSPDSVYNIIKPGMAITSKPMMALDSPYLLDGALNMAAHPVLASVALPLSILGAAKGGSMLARRIGRGKRLAQLRKGIAPKEYRQQAQALGFR